MGRSITGTKERSRATYKVLEEMIREKMREFIRDLLREEVRLCRGSQSG